MTSQYVALFRGINVGTGRKVPMSELKAVFEKLGYEDVVSYINSGNVLFAAASTPDVAAIENALKSTFGFRIDTLVLSEKAIRQIAKSIPTDWQNDGSQKSDVIFLFSEYDSPETLVNIRPREQYETGLYVPGALLWNVKRENRSRNSILKLAGTDLYRRLTIRNVNTVRKLVVLLDKRSSV